MQGSLYLRDTMSQCLKKLTGKEKLEKRQE